MEAQTDYQNVSADSKKPGFKFTAIIFQHNDTPAPDNHTVLLCLALTYPVSDYNPKSTQPGCTMTRGTWQPEATWV